MVREAARGHGAELDGSRPTMRARLVDAVQRPQGRADGALINAAALTHTSLALRDALLAGQVPFVETAPLDIFAREPAPHHSMIADLAVGLVTGFGAQSYLLAPQALGGPTARGPDRRADRQAALRVALDDEGLDTFPRHATCPTSGT